MDGLKDIYAKIKKMWCRLNKKTKDYILLIVIVSIALQGLNMLGAAKDLTLTPEDLKLPEYGQKNIEIPVDVHYKDDKGRVSKFSTVIELEPQTYSEAEAKLVLDNVCGKLDEIILGSNSSLEQVHSNLDLVRMISGIPVDISWYSTDYEVVDSGGHVNNADFEENQQKDIVLYALVSCGEYSREHAINVTVVNKDLDEDEYLVAGINKVIGAALKEKQGNTVSLPQSYNGGTITYYKSNEQPGYAYLILGIVAIGVVIIGDSGQKRQMILERKKQLSFDYSEVVSKITLLLGAGMTMQRAWEKIVSDYKEQRHSGKTRYVYEEMVESYNQMKIGVPEVEVYEQFGKRCDLKEYQKFSTLIIQNLRKGTKDLTSLLELEVIEAFEKRKNLARVKGEEAGTKLLIPMVIMLLVVMVVIMVPALITFEM